MPRPVLAHRLSTSYWLLAEVRSGIGPLSELFLSVSLIFREIQASDSLESVESVINDEQKIQIASGLRKLHKIFDNQINARKNLCSIHEPGTACIAKGKDGKKYEFGSKASIVMTKTSGIIIGVKDFQGNPFDGKTLKPSLDMAAETVGEMPKNVFTDRGYRGAQKDLENTTHHVPEAPKSNATDFDKEEARKNFGRRSAIEPVISHIKSDFRLARNFLKGSIGFRPFFEF